MPCPGPNSESRPLAQAFGPPRAVFLPVLLVDLAIPSCMQPLEPGVGTLEERVGDQGPLASELGAAWQSLDAHGIESDDVSFDMDLHVFKPEG